MSYALLMWPLRGHGRENPNSIAAVRSVCGEDEGKWMWKLDGMNGNGQGWMEAGNLVENPHCQKLHYEMEMKMHQKTRNARRPGFSPGPAGGI
jgi:hypothetical protein